MRLLLSFFILFVIACQGPTPVIDPHFTSEEVKALRLNLKAIEKVKLSLPTEFIDSPEGEAFRFLFPVQDKDETAFGEYFNQRISYILPVRARVYLPEVITFDSSVLATNIGILLWYNHLQGKTDSRIDSTPFQVKNGNEGLIILGESFLEQSRKMDMLRVKTLVHEARHSDCAKNPSGEDLVAYQNGSDMKDYSCGYPHVVCPMGSDLEGLYACDSSVWGGYAVEALVLKALSVGCVNCKSRDREDIEAAILEAASRVQNAGAVFAGKFGMPELTIIDARVRAEIDKNAMNLFDARKAGIKNLNMEGRLR